jgi:DNA-binding SARP family transcriptional activator
VTAALEFCLLGPLAVRGGGLPVAMPRGKQRTVLAALLLNANQVVSFDDLAETLWGAGPPPSARVTIQNYVMRLRNALGDTGGARIATQPRGYVIRVDPAELDVTCFEARLAAARLAARDGSWDAAADQVRAALSLWRGEPLEDVDSQVLALREVPRLTELRLQALETRIDADLHLGRHGEVIGELRRLAGAYPLRERLHGQLMLALYRDGRQAEALAAYQKARRILLDEIGVEPGTELRELHQRLLAADPVLAAAEPASPVAAGASPAVPRELPAGVRYFTGRAAELAALTKLLDRSGQALPETVVISAIGGTAGVGKTALAVHWARQVAGRFPDGQLYVNLRGYDPGPPMPPAQALAGFLRALGLAGQDIPAETDERAARYRSLLAGRRMLVILDNARDPAQVRPLLPGSPGSLVLVTSRDRLTGLAAADGAHVLVLDVLAEAEARELLARRLGTGRIAAEPAAVTELSRLCARLPLALSVAAARAAERPDLPLTMLAAGLRDTPARLDEFSTGDPVTDVRTVFSWSCRQLSESAGRMFRLLGVHPGPDITVPAAASLAGLPVAQARQSLTELTRAHLVIEPTPGRYTCHDLLRAYAVEQAGRLESAADRRAARHRMLDHYLHTAAAASYLLASRREPIPLSPPQPQVRPEELADDQQALSWFRAEHQVLLAAISLAADAGFWVHAWQLPWATATFFDWQGYWHDLVATQNSAATAARHVGDQAGEALIRCFLGRAQIRLGAYAEASANLAESINLSQQTGNQSIEARAHIDLWRALKFQGQGRDAFVHAEQSLRLYRAAGNRWGEAIALNVVGWGHAQFGDHHEALVYCGQALVLDRELGNLPGEADALDSLGYAHHHLGHYADAIACYQQAIDMGADVGDVRIRAQTLVHLGEAQQAAGDSAAARHTWQAALAILDGLHDPEAAQLRSRLSWK